MNEQTPERKYALIKIGPGDYLLPGNDAATLWRIAKYEDGPSHGIDAMPRDRDFWGAWRFRHPLARAIRMDYAVDEWDEENWAMEVAHCDTRADAIRLALTT